MNGLTLLSTGSYAGSRVVTNDDFAKVLDTSDEWIYSRTGIHERHFCSEEESCVSLAREASKKALERAEKLDIDPSYIAGDAAYELAKLIGGFPQAVKEAAGRYEPSVVTRHIVDTAQSFNKFYHDEHIIVDNIDEQAAKLALVIAAKNTIKNGLALLGMQCPERM